MLAIAISQICNYLQVVISASCIFYFFATANLHANRRLKLTAASDARLTFADFARALKAYNPQIMTEFVVEKPDVSCLLRRSNMDVHNIMCQSAGFLIFFFKWFISSLVFLTLNMTICAVFAVPDMLTMTLFIIRMMFYRLSARSYY